VRVPHRRWAWSWLAAVSYWDVERHEVEIVVDEDLVQNIQVRIDRARSTPLARAARLNAGSGRPARCIKTEGPSVKTSAALLHSPALLAAPALAQTPDTVFLES
jgi:hypothetical protein